MTLGENKNEGSRAWGIPTAAIGQAFANKNECLTAQTTGASIEKGKNPCALMVRPLWTVDGMAETLEAVAECHYKGLNTPSSLSGYIAVSEARP